MASTSLDASPAKRRGDGSKDEASQHYSKSFESGQLSESMPISSKDERSQQYSASFEPASPKDEKSQSQYYSTSFDQSSPVSSSQVRAPGRAHSTWHSSTFATALPRTPYAGIQGSGDGSCPSAALFSAGCR